MLTIHIPRLYCMFLYQNMCCHLVFLCLKVVQVAATSLKWVVSIKVYLIMAMANHLMLAPGMEHFRQYLYSGLRKPHLLMPWTFTNLLWESGIISKIVQLTRKCQVEISFQSSRVFGSSLTLSLPQNGMFSYLIEKALTIRKCVSTNFAPLFRENTILGSLKPTVENPKEGEIISFGIYSHHFKYPSSST